LFTRFTSFSLEVLEFLHWEFPARTRCMGNSLRRQHLESLRRFLLESSSESQPGTISFLLEVLVLYNYVLVRALSLHFHVKIRFFFSLIRILKIRALTRSRVLSFLMYVPSSAGFPRHSFFFYSQRPLVSAGTAPPPLTSQVLMGTSPHRVRVPPPPH